MSEEGWISVITKKERRDKKGNRRKYISESLATKLQHDLDITGLAVVLLSTESRNLQEDGWTFDRVLKSDENSESVEEPKNTDLVQYDWLPTQNKWGDRVLFSRRINPSDDS